MSPHPRHRPPAAFRLDDPDVVVTAPGDERAPLTGVRITPEPEPVMPATIAESAIGSPPRRRRWRLGTLFWSAFGGLVLLGLGLAVVSLIEDLFARNDALGWLALVLAAVAGAALFVILVREGLSLWRLEAMEALRARAAAVLVSDDRAEGAAVMQDLLRRTRSTPRLARSRAQLEHHLGEIIDGADLVRLAERELLRPLDEEARRLVSTAAQRVSVVTAVSPRAAVDMVFVLLTAVGLVRRLACVYGGRPGALGLAHLLRLTISHLAFTGGLAVSDGLLQQVLGHGVIAKLSTRLGEGVLNGLLTARLGLAAIEVIRPLPFEALPPPALADLAGDLIRKREKEPG